MERLSLTMLFLALAVLGQAEARSLISKQAADQPQQKISPPLHDVKSDKKFFGPPFPADYPDDKRPVPDKNILDMVKSPGQAYPALQSKEDYDKDFVKDENSDKGAWEAQFEYDHLRRDLKKAEEDAKRAQARADAEGRDADGAQGDDDSAAGKVRQAQKDLDEAVNGEEKAKTAEDFEGPPSDEKLKEIRKAIDAAEAKYAKEQQDFLKCQKQLEDAKKELEDLKAQQKEMEAKLAADTKLWAEQKTVKMNLKKAHRSEAAAKVKAAMDKLTAAEKKKADADKKLAKEKAEHDQAKAKLQKEKTEHETAHKQLSKAADRLQKLHGYKPAAAEVAPLPAKSSASQVSVATFFALSMLVAVGCL